VQTLNLLIMRAQAGDLDAYSTIVRQFQDMAIGYSYALLGDRQLAEDAAQEAFIDAYQELPRLREPAAFPSWFRKIVFKQCDRLVRGRRVAIKPLEEAAEIRSDVPEPAEVVEARERQYSLLKGIKALPEHERTVIVLFYFGGYSQAEISSFLDLPVTTVKNRLYTARRRLQERMVAMAKRNFYEQSSQQEDMFTAEVIETLRRRGLDLFEEYATAPEKRDSILQQVIAHLSQAFRLGNYDPETVWILTRALRYVSDMDGIIAVLKQYADHAPDREQAFLARHYLVDHYALMGRDSEAVAVHKDMLQRLRGLAPAERLLWSLSDTTMLRSWKKCKALDEWRAIADDLYQSIEETAETCNTRAEYLRTLTEAVYLPAGEYAQAEATCQAWMALMQTYSDQVTSTRWLLIDGRGILLSIYATTEQHDRVKETISAGRQEALAYAQWVAEQQAAGDDADMGAKALARHQSLCQAALHNFACQCMWAGYYDEAIPLFERALTLKDDPATHFFLAGTILKAAGDKNRSLAHFRQAIQNPAFSRRHDLRQAFLAEGTFEAAWNDPHFLDLIDQEVQKLVQQRDA
jgi:RNA polymerase sigma factor (sigma-70 family)